MNFKITGITRRKIESVFNESKATYIAIQDLEVELLHVIVAMAENYPLAKNVRAIGLRGFLELLDQTK